ncbi:hypothetical protein AB1Y20_005002 [Prymnesium parvum]|uniref:Major facilitator superfamily (MFS) profile domain-containing protein n=1 Tax=Prymnesium parvum TaxID=97485 RepID=A0AB34J303_PRYPA
MLLPLAPLLFPAPPPRAALAFPRSCMSEEPPEQVIRLTKLIVFTDYAAVGAMRTVLPFYAKALGAAATGVGALEALYGAGQVGGALLLGSVSDARGRKPVLLASVLGSVIGYAMAGLAVGMGSTSLLLLSRLPVGFSKQTVTASRAIASDVTAEAQRSHAISGLVGAMALGYALGPYVGGLLVDHASAVPQLPAFLCAGAFVFLAPVIHFRLPETCAATRRPSLPPPPSRQSEPQAPSRAGAPSAWAQPGLLLLLAACALPEAAIIAGSTALPLLAIQHLRWDASRLGLFTSVWGLLVGGLSLGPLSRLLRNDRLTDRTACILGALLLATGAAVLAARGTSTLLWACLPVYVPAVSLLRTAPAALVTKTAQKSVVGEALGILDATSSVARIVTPLLCGILFDRVGPSAPFGLQAALSLGGAAALVGGTSAVRRSGAASKEE